MLLLANCLGRLSFSRLMEVYLESNLEKARGQYPQEAEAVGLRTAEEDFYQYLAQVFFARSGSCYAVWVENGCYVSALRLEPWQDGLLLTGLETAPDMRRQGYAEKLMRGVLERFSGQVLYSHIHKENAASLAVHDRCGFLRIRESARYLDGSVNDRACTMVFGTTLETAAHI